MDKYRIKKIGRVGDNHSTFGDTREFFEGYSETPPTLNERFVLRDRLGGTVINTSGVMKIEDDKFSTYYSVFFQIET